jgi:hypothetical protein
MKTFVFTGRIFLPLFISSMIFSFQGCKKTEETQSADEEIATNSRRPNQPSASPFSFTNCSSPGFNGNFVTGSPANVTFRLNYANGPGGSYPSFTSARVNGIIITAPSGTLNTGAGSITFTASGTPIAAGYFSIPVSIRGSTCNLQIAVSNAPATGSNGDPAAAVGSTGVVRFTYQNQAVAYKTVRAADGKIWIQQNLGSPQVASSSIDEASFGHFFQWGRWDDGHQLPNSSTIVGNSSLQNPSQIASGNPGFIKNQTQGLSWWGTGGLSTDTWSGNIPTSTNGTNPCAALGAGWRMPTAAEWQNVINQEHISDTYTAYQSNLKLPAGGVRFFNDGTVHVNGDVGYSWTSTADGTQAKAVFIDNAYGLFISPVERGNGYPCRCVKD